MRIALSCALAALACTGPARPRDVRAFVSERGVEVQWEPAALVTRYRVQLVDFDSGAAVSAPVVVRGSHVTLPGTASGVWVDAVPGERAMSVVSSGSEGGSGAPWQVFAMLALLPRRNTELLLQLMKVVVVCLMLRK